MDFNCKNQQCNLLLRVPELFAGKPVKCPKCGEIQPAPMLMREVRSDAAATENVGTPPPPSNNPTEDVLDVLPAEELMPASGVVPASADKQHGLGESLLKCTRDDTGFQVLKIFFLIGAIGSGAVILLCLAALAISLALTLSAPTPAPGMNSPGIGKGIVPLVVFCLIAIVGLIACILLFKYVRRPPTSITLFVRGFVYSLGSQTRTYRWEDVEVFVWAFTNLRTYLGPIQARQDKLYDAALRRHDGRVYTLDNEYSNVVEFCQIVEKKTFRHILARLLASVKAGELVDLYGFQIKEGSLIAPSKREPSLRLCHGYKSHYYRPNPGPVARFEGDPSGPVAKGEGIPWSQVGRATVADGHVWIHDRTQRPRAKVTIGNIQNYAVFVALINRIVSADI